MLVHTIRWVGLTLSRLYHVILQIGMQSFKDNVILELFNQIVKEPCFNTLRTKEQLGSVQ